ncbi:MULTISPECIES: hybrid sensor histidine kinase/response regulator [Maribacter]|uniref:histidine kinase n=1 Tax=Maribacter flavus TaxID=1658664 RepID=A0A5B2U0V7_9FLAO|nr:MULTISPECIES: hybrid sensor histidine kinase/response regulator [Maribacter]KAA2219615.1 response regulator [Maribacter flavus]MDC6404572.1 7TM diverse intracellular signaling domain-containing protein [Maribacter sp. PR66]MEE1971715.1 7TM diverse intracellular signaling domain-containing protein [Maribacter flavus]
MLSKEQLFSTRITFLFLVFGITFLNAQIQVSTDLNVITSLKSNATMYVAGDEVHSIDYILKNEGNLNFRPLKDFKNNYGFTKDHLWIKFEIENVSNEDLFAYLQTARPITDVATFYEIGHNEVISLQKSGDVIPFQEKSVRNRKSVFKVFIPSNSTLSGIIHLKSDGEVVMLPLDLIPTDYFLETTYKEQMFYGLFYGILFMAFIVYLFFYFGLKDVAFAYYSLYVFFIALMQFSLDGFFHQYITPNGGWLSNYAVLLTALLSLLFFVKYGSEFLGVKKQNKWLYNSYLGMCLVILIALGALVVIPGFLSITYPIANAIGLVVLVQALTTLVYYRKKEISVDPSFVMGISFLVFGFIVFILNNFNAVESSFFTDNGAKFGIGLEITFLSISMSKRIRTLRMENEKNQLLALQRAEDMNEIKSSFISNISHELRTPLNLIMGVAHSLKEKKQEKEIGEKCELILNSSENLLGHIDDILDFTVIEKGNQELKQCPFNISTAIQKVLDENQLKAKQKGLDFNIDIPSNLPGRIIGDRLKLIRIIDHLLDNSIKFTSTGKVTFNLRYRIEEESKFYLNLEVSDSGTGITKEKMSTIFEAFTKKSFLDKREFSGLGLGLFIVKNYVDLHNGTIDIKNNEGGGTKFNVNLVLGYDAELNTTLVDKDEEEAYDLDGARILLVEDNKMNQQVIKLMAKKWKNTTLSIANNGKEGLDLLCREDFDIVLMDLQMPVMDGFEAIAMIRGGKVSSKVTNIPIVVLTADSTDKTRKEIFRLGVNDYATKPINCKLVYRKISRSLTFKKAS